MNKTKIEAIYSESPGRSTICKGCDFHKEDSYICKLDPMGESYAESISEINKTTKAKMLEGLGSSHIMGQLEYHTSHKQNVTNTLIGIRNLMKCAVAKKNVIEE